MPAPGSRARLPLPSPTPAWRGEEGRHGGLPLHKSQVLNGYEFLSCGDACIQQVCRMPELHAKVHEDYRRALVRRFPYAVFYEYASGTVTVYVALKGQDKKSR